MRCKNDSDAALMLSDAEKAIRRASYEWLHNGHDFEKTAKKLNEATGLLDAVYLYIVKESGVNAHEAVAEC